MGAATFGTVAEGKTAREAFAAATSQARYEHGHGGYSGTIAEKSSFVVVSATKMTIADAQAKADRLIKNRDSRVDDKWGPAGCIPPTDGGYYFFGWASE